MKRFIRNLFAGLWRRVVPDIIVMRRIGDTLFHISLRDHLYWILRGEDCRSEKVPFPANSRVWDLGSNIGLHAVAMARAGCQVTAFDISETNVLCLRQTARQNGLDIEVVLSLVTVEPTMFTPAGSGHTEECLKRGGLLRALTFMEAAERFGMPRFIKVDIEGGEIDLLEDFNFRHWIFVNRITVYLEVHGGNERWLWTGFRRVDVNHWVLEPWDYNQTSKSSNQL